jgi:hypothetical protein
VRADDVILTYKPCGHVQQYRAIVQRSAAGRGYDPTGRGYAVDRSPRGKTEKIRCAHAVEDIICYF